MDQIKIGKFISKCRKEKKLTQAQLAERLCITDKAISKWERGIAMPDSAIMLDLCKALDINVNDLLNGEKISEEDKHRKTEELLLEMTRKEEMQRKRLFVTSWSLFVIWLLFFFFVVATFVAFVDDLLTLNILIIVSFIFYLVGGLILVKAELKSGRYVCQNCQHVFETDALFVMNTINGKPQNWKYYLKCPKCNKKTWTKRILPK